ncbi:hypothetical protein [Acinetobacter pragensis]|uniref:Spore coat protein U domain-containing protein n=1 Tax=Acinetobacter pragensis TaxID=1806892 RepID=A0A151Y1Z2_9GAMM|nr:hypothetical protein [Acinetobacter pragensis]KYQ72053.1 hypothetical protein AZH43_12630 [Acinetobacter pragensis]
MAKTEQAIITEMRCGTLMPVALASMALVLQGTFAAVDASGYAIASEDVGGADQNCLGIWDHSAENTGADGDVVACVRRKQQFLVRNSTTDPVTQADLGAVVYMEDNQTIAKTDGTNTLSVAGHFMGFDVQYPEFVWVEIE